MDWFFMPGDMSISDVSRLFGILVTFRRPTSLDLTLQRLAQQRLALARLVVVDNSPSEESRSIIRTYAREALAIRHIESAENVGPAGGIALGMRHIMAIANDWDWLVTLDDDDLPWDESVLAALHATARRTLRTDARTGCVGTGGGCVDWKNGRLNIASDDKLKEGVPVDCIGGNRFPMYLVQVARKIGTFNSSLFWGFEELEYGLRLRRAGYSIHIDQVLRGERRESEARRAAHRAVSTARPPALWRRYYGYRNLIFIFRLFGGDRAAACVTARALGKPVAEMLRARRFARAELAMAFNACVDGWIGRLGRRFEPIEVPGARRVAE